MTKSEIKRLPKSTVELTMTIPWSKIKEVYERTFIRVMAEVELPGFRKGKAPRKLIEEKIDRSKVYEEVIKEVVPEAYTAALKEHDVKPIVSPQVDLLEAKEDSDWKIKATVAQKPEVHLKNYKAAVAKAKTGAGKLWVPGQGEPEKKEDKEKVKLDDVIKALLEEVEVEIPDLLVTEEANRLLARLVDETKLLGMTVDQYLKARGKTGEQLRADYAQQAQDSLKITFILEAVADTEKITVSDKEIEEAINAVKDESERVKLREQSYYIASLIRRQKTLDSLVKPIV